MKTAKALIPCAPSSLMRWWTPLIVSLVLAACGSDPDESAPSYWPEPAFDTGASSDAGADARVSIDLDDNSTSDEIALACIAVCDARSVDAGCIAPGTPCHDLCFTAVVGAVELADEAFECILTDPLCYQSLGQCVLGRRYPEPFEHTVTLLGVGYDEFVGASVIAGIEESAERIEYGTATVDPNGEFRAQMVVELHALDAHTVMYWLDLDDDGVCNPEEPTGSGTYQLDTTEGVLEVPDWVVEVDRASVPDSAFVCDFL